MKRTHHLKRVDVASVSNSRRDFLMNSAALAALAATGPFTELSAQGRAVPASDKMNGIQVGPVSFVDEGVEHVLDNFQKLGGLNTVFLTTFTYGRGLSGRQIPGQ